MARAISQRCSEQPANASAFAKSSPGPTPRGLTERPSASFKQHCANGPTLAPTTTRISDRTSSCTGSIATTEGPTRGQNKKGACRTKLHREHRRRGAWDGAVAVQQVLFPGHSL